MIGTSAGTPVCCEPEHPGARPPADVLLDHQIPGIEIALRSDPRVVADHAAAVEAALDERLLADHHAVADLERLGVPGDGPAADPHAVAEAAASARQVARRIRASASLSPWACLDARSSSSARECSRRSRSASSSSSGGSGSTTRRPCTAGTTRAVGAVHRSGRAAARQRPRGAADATSSICASVSSGYIGSDSTSRAAASDTGKSPSAYPRSRYAGCRCTGIG